MSKEPSPKQVLSIRCPTCGAAPGEKCELSTGQPRTEPHRERLLIAEEHLVLTGGSPMTPEDLIDELSHNVVLAQDGPELERALGELQSGLQEYRDYLESAAADYLLRLPLAIRKRLSKLHATIAA